MATAKNYKRATDFVKGIGKSLPANVDMLLIRFTVDARTFSGSERAIVYMTLAPVDEPENVDEYHAWSDSLAQKLAEIPDDVLPLVVRFVKTRTRAGFEVWNIE